MTYELDVRTTHLKLARAQEAYELHGERYVCHFFETGLPLLPHFKSGGEKFEAFSGVCQRLLYKDAHDRVVPLTPDVARSKFEFTYTILKRTTTKVRSRALTLLVYQSIG
jgi:hypothetical protein